MNYTQVQRLVLYDGLTFDHFGEALVSINPDLMMIAAHRHSFQGFTENGVSDIYRRNITAEVQKI